MAELPQNISSFERVNEAASYIKERLPSSLRSPRVAIVCGTGLGGLVHTVGDTPRVEYDYSSIPHFPQLTVTGHAGKLVFGLLGQKVPAVLMLGRAHYYEGHSIDKVTFPVRVLKLLGIDTIVLTNAAGGLNPEYAVGDLVLLNDHIFIAGLAGTHPLRGPNVEEFGPRFPPLSDAYDLELRRYVHKAWKTVIPSQSKRRLHEGAYAFVGGPSYETRAECRMLRQLGADLVGMSTVPEIVAARHCDLRVIALSLVTNKAVLSPVPRGDDHLLEAKEAEELDAILQEGKANHEEVLEAARSAALDMQDLVQKTVQDIFQQH
ncbi:purine-nucleoside phosphorylase [Aspergillus glaucus CBS 516.65]|uniref:Purine nucleoside phosphorylase n=1 Tax=Aspergillus glaucus CBS 516.65 TaxID=1160497 RepID=A0A1L9VLZ1_ASPGL|nr:hypothetical protein ASPGLDRAFT_57811 [Aspergillus glaucus CBS 516.65]OJJ84915.1 hypothetical protein ASPGLDRAFT_57811 [Aspergillus glaucus CBS 516.65]